MIDFLGKSFFRLVLLTLFLLLLTSCLSNRKNYNYATKSDDTDTAKKNSPFYHSPIIYNLHKIPVIIYLFKKNEIQKKTLNNISGLIEKIISYIKKIYIKNYSHFVMKKSYYTIFIENLEDEPIAEMWFHSIENDGFSENELFFIRFENDGSESKTSYSINGESLMILGKEEEFRLRCKSFNEYIFRLKEKPELPQGLNIY